MKTQLKYMFALLIAAVLIGTALMIAAYSLPTSSMLNHIKGSADSMKLGEVPRWAKNSVHTSLDNFADAIILCKAAYPVKNPIVDSMLVPSWNPIWDGVYYPARGFVQIAETGHLEVDKGENIYPRYWHGYLTVIKPLLLFFSSEKLKVLNLYLQTLLAFLALILIFKRLGLYYMYSFALIIIIINPVTTALAFQHSNVYITMLLTVILILLFNDKLNQNNRYPYFFMAIGIITAFFDLLTYPLVPLGIGSVIYLALNKHTLSNSALMKLINFSFSWTFGYFGMWSSKIFMATLITGHDVFHDALAALAMRTAHHSGSMGIGEPITVMQAILANIMTCYQGPIKIFLLLTLMFIIYLSFKHKANFNFNKFTFTSLSFTAALPLLWYAFLCNHSFAHAHFTYRELTITTFSILAFFIESIQPIRQTHH